MRFMKFCLVLLALCGTACASTNGTPPVSFPTSVDSGREGAIAPVTMPAATIAWTTPGYSPVPAMTVTHSLPEPTFAPLVANNIAAGAEIYTVWWSADSGTLFYRIYDRILAYDIADEQIRKISLTEYFQPTPQPEIVSRLPPQANKVFVSPSGIRALYFNFIHIPPTPKGDLGEYVHLGIIAELWLQVEDGVPQKLAEAPYCYPADALWTEDELKVIIDYTDPLIRCEESHIWLLDLQSAAIHFLLSVKEFPIPVRLVALSPNNQWLLFNATGRDDDGNNIYPLFILNVDTLQIIQLNTPPAAIGEGWLSNKKVLVYYQHWPETFWTFGGFDIETESLSVLTPSLENVCVAVSSLSPDRRWFAYTTGVDCTYIDSLWLLRIDLIR
jgi:hypothetical protein